MPIFGYSKCIPVFLGKLVGKNLEQPFLTVLNLYQSFWEKLLEKVWNAHFWPFQINTSLFGKNCWKKSECLFLAVPNLYQSFWEKLLEKIQNGHFWSFQINTSLFGKNCWKKFGMAIFGHSKFFLTIILYILL